MNSEEGCLPRVCLSVKTNFMSHSATPLTSHFCGPLKGKLTVPGDKSISHRALMLGAMARGKTIISGLLEGEDVLHTAQAMQAMGVGCGKTSNTWWVEGVGAGQLKPPSQTLYMGNSGTSTRLLMGLVGGHAFTSEFAGDASLEKRPMARVMEPLEKMGVRFESLNGGRLPLKVIGTSAPTPIEYRLKVASAQVKSAILLCGLNANGITTVIEPHATRDHTENMLRHFGATIDVRIGADGATIIALHGKPDLKAADINVPADPSSAAFPVAAALLKDGSDILIPNICLNPLRTGFYETLREMGADIEFTNTRISAGEKIADLHVRYGALKGVDVLEGRAPSMIDEYPILAVLAACAQGTTRMNGLGELRVKESDRLAVMADGLKACGANLEVEGDNLIVHGNGTPPRGGATIATALDHRIAMSFLVLGSATPDPITVDDSSMIATSFPSFVSMMNAAGMRLG